MTTVDVNTYHQKLIDLVIFINQLELNPLVKSVELIQEGSITLDFITNNILDSFNANHANNFIVNACSFLLEEMVDDYESLPFHQVMAIQDSFESLNLKQALLIVNSDSEFATAYFITINEGVVSGFLAKMEDE